MAATQGHRTHLAKRGRTGQFRRLIPADLVAAVGRKEFSRSLRTPKYRKARQRAALLEANLERMLDGVRASRTMVDTEEPMPAIVRPDARPVKSTSALAEDRRLTAPGKGTSDASLRSGRHV
jgi:hypothetical protein